MAGKGRRKGSVRSLADVVREVYPDVDGLREARAFAAWLTAAPPRVVKNARPVKLDRGTMFIHVTTAAWANELTLLAPDLLARIRRAAYDVPVRALRFKVGPLPDLPERHVHPPKPKAPLATSQLPEELARELGQLHDDGLRTAVLRAAAMGLADPIPEPPRKGRKRASSLD